MTIQARRFASRSSTRQTTHLNSDKKVNFGAERNGAFAAKPLGESPRNASLVGIFRVSFLLYLPSVFVCVLFRAAFSMRRFFYAPKLLFHSFSSRTLLPENVKKTIQNLFQPIHAFFVRCCKIELCKRLKIFQTGQKPSGLSFRIC